MLTVDDTTPSQRAARATWLLICRSLVNAGGLTTRELAQALGMTYSATWKMLMHLCTGDGPPITKHEHKGGEWFIPPDMLP